MSTNYDFGVADIDAFYDDVSTGSGSAARNSGPSSHFWTMKAGSERQFYFVADYPHPYAWFTWFQAYCGAGIDVGNGMMIELDGGNMAFAVKGYPESEKGQTDELLAAVRPYKGNFDDRPKKQVNPKFGFNVVELSEDGEPYPPKILVMSGARGREVVDQIRSWQAMIGDDFTLLGKMFNLELTKGTDAKATLTPVRDSAPIDLPEPLNIPELLNEQRGEIAEIIAANTGYAPESAPVSAAEPSAPTLPDDVSEAERISGMGPTKLRTELKKAGVAVPPDATHEVLVEMMLKAKGLTLEEEPPF